MTFCFALYLIEDVVKYHTVRSYLYQQMFVGAIFLPHKNLPPIVPVAFVYYSNKPFFLLNNRYVTGTIVRNIFLLKTQ